MKMLIQWRGGNLAVLYFLCLIFLGTLSQAQGLSREQLQDSVLPSFSAYKDNYFITGIPLNTGISETTADVKYQISFKQLLSRHVLPYDTQLFLTYTQKAFWNVYEFSSFFEEVNFNPGIGLGRGIFDEDGHLIGITEFKVEHESNGREGSASRSWNSLSLAYHTMLNPYTVVGVKGWIPFGYKSDNKDLIKHIGYGELNLMFDLAPKWKLDIAARKGAEWNWKGNVRARLFFRVSQDTNQHIMLEWYAGNAESLIDFDRHENMIRIGYAIKSPDLNVLKLVKKRLVK